MHYPVTPRGILCLLMLCLLWLNGLPASSHIAPDTSVNAVIGDISYYERFGRRPGNSTDENLRISTHLSYVEKLLRSRVPSTVPAELLPRRRQMLDLLRRYRQAGVFPTQHVFAGRRPHFIDERGRLCAVGYLVAQTAGRDLAEKINRKYAYAYLPDMNLPELEAWATGSGLTPEELAMIQPGYGSSAPVATPLEDLLLVLMISVGWIFVPNLLAFALPAETYASIQLSDILVTFSLMMLLQVSILVILNRPPPSFYDREVETGASMAGAGFALLVASMLANIVILDGFGRDVHQKLREQAELQMGLGSFRLPDRTSAWGLHASLSF